MKTFGFGIIGCGIISVSHVGAIRALDNAKLVGAYDAVPERAANFAKENECQAFETLEAMLACSDVDIVCICTPSGLHADAAVAAANAGKHIIVEKPMAITRDQLNRIVEAVERNGVQLGSICQLRFSNDVKRLKAAIADGEFGRLLLGDVYMKMYRSPEYYASAGWRGTWAMDGGGVLMNQGIHGIDLLQYLMGPVKAVSAVCRTMDRDIEVEDTAVATVEFASGAVGIIEATTCMNPGRDNRIEILGTKGHFTFTGDAITEWCINGAATNTDAAVFEKDTAANPTAFSPSLHTLQFADFLEALTNGTKPLIDVYEGKRPVDVILSIYESSKSGQKVFLD
ncbi:MAG: Gfo/Idh/MocA family oxidoreductase [Ruminococcaceae bacterium]|nr:Gfo/Idh/MocA family oxidoreductase [Oscillospiraceae bacterium]